ncbi:hypothetical protein B566_EDAN000913 [Ephemera danica]|nr:hypothetical protein B566_EDAN000913 [Ephemera danica]
MILVLLVAIVFFDKTVLPADVAAKSQWPRSKILNADSGFMFAWNPQPDEDGFFHFSLKTHTHGYIGFGLSDTGTMAGADLLIAWPNVTADNTSRDAQQRRMKVLSGSAGVGIDDPCLWYACYLRYTTEYKLLSASYSILVMKSLQEHTNGLPSVDAHANWQLVGGTWTPDFPGSRNGGGIIEIQVARLVDTKDPQDLPIANVIRSTDAMEYRAPSTSSCNSWCERSTRAPSSTVRNCETFISPLTPMERYGPYINSDILIKHTWSSPCLLLQNSLCEPFSSEHLQEHASHSLRKHSSKLRLQGTKHSQEQLKERLTCNCGRNP